MNTLTERPYFQNAFRINQKPKMIFLFTIHCSLFTAFLELAKEGNKAYLQCLDPCEITGGGTAIFEVELRK